MTSPIGPATRSEFPTPSYLDKVICEKVAQFLVDARARTLSEGKDLLQGLSSMRETWVAECGGKEITLRTEDGDCIDGLHFEGTLNKAIIYLHGNGCFYETSAQRPLSFREALKQTSDEGIDSYPHLIVFNPRGTAESKGITHPDNVARDILAVFEHLVFQHAIDPNGIVIMGHSMGAFFGAFGAELVQQRFPDNAINYLGDRGFIDIKSRADLKIQSGEYSRVARVIFSAVIHSLITRSKWDRNSVVALESLKGRVCIIYHKGDLIIPYDTSTHLAITRAHRTRSYCCLSLQEENMKLKINPSHAHMREFNEEENKKVIAELKKMMTLPLTAEEELLSLDLLEP